MPTYLRKPGSRMWHWCRNCPSLPRDKPLDVLYSQPAEGRLCPECQTLARRGCCAASLASEIFDGEGGPKK